MVVRSKRRRAKVTKTETKIAIARMEIEAEASALRAARAARLAAKRRRPLSPEQQADKDASDDSTIQAQQRRYRL
jgi:hypothetical protein